VKDKDKEGEKARKKDPLYLIKVKKMKKQAL
jgi:hypothetical protein